MEIINKKNKYIIINNNISTYYMNKEQKYIKKYIFCMRGAIENCVTEYKTKKKM